MDSQLAFFLVRPAKAMGRKGADPDTVILAGHSNAPSDRASDVPIFKMDFFAQEMWGWGVTSLEAVARGMVTAGPWQGCSGEGLPCARPRRWPHCADGQERVSALESLGLTPPRAGFELGLALHCTPKAFFPARGVIGVGAKPLQGSWGHGWAGGALWGSLGSPLIPMANTAGVRGGKGVTHAHQPSFPSQRWGRQGGFPSRMVSDGRLDLAWSPPVPRSRGQ